MLGISRGGLSGWNDPLVIGGLVAAAVLLPLVRADRAPRPRADARPRRSSENRLFAAATGAAFINGLSRFALMFVFVFYFQGAQGDDPITAGIKLAPMAIGMLIASPLAGIWADRHGSRALAALGMLVSAVALAAMTTLAGRHPLLAEQLWLLLVGIGSGMFNSPEHGGDDGHRARHRRGIAAGARTMLQNTGAVISIAFVLAIVTAAVPQAGPVQDLLRPRQRALATRSSSRSSHNMHTALWVLALTSLVGAGVSLLRPRHARRDDGDGPSRPPRVLADEAT